MKARGGWRITAKLCDSPACLISISRTKTQSFALCPPCGERNNGGPLFGFREEDRFIVAGNVDSFLEALPQVLERLVRRLCSVALTSGRVTSSGLLSSAPSFHSPTQRSCIEAASHLLQSKSARCSTFHVKK